MNWKPIETAPKDGTDILLCRMHEGRCVTMQIGAWTVARPQADGFVAGRGQPFWIAYDSVHLVATPTHWMQLPPPPEDEPNGP